MLETSQTPILTASIVTYFSNLTVLKDTIDSLRKCQLPIELVIIDNSRNSQYFKELRETTGEKCIKSPANRGYGFGHNLALQYISAARYHLVLNPDVIIHEGCIENILSRMEEDTSIGLTTPRILNKDGSLQLLNKNHPDVFNLFIRRFIPKAIQETKPVRRYMDKFVMMDKGYDCSYEVPFVSGCFMFFRRNILNKIGGFDENFFMYFEDADISRRANEASKVIYCPEAVITHLWARHSHTKIEPTINAIASAHKYFQKWGWKWF